MTMIYEPIPDGRVAGCLPRKTRFGEICPLYSERLEVLSDAELKAREGHYNLRQFTKVMLNQGNVGSCATEATAGAMMIQRAFSGMPHVTLNPWFIYYETSGGRDQGSSIDENLAFARSRGVCPMSVWGRDKGWKKRPSDEAFREALKFKIEEFYDLVNIREAKSANALGYPVVYGARGHAVVKIFYGPGGSSLDLNSWGENWKDKGFGLWASYEDIDFRYGAFAVRVVTEIGPAPPLQ